MNSVTTDFYNYGILPNLWNHLEKTVKLFLYAQENGFGRLRYAIASKFAVLPSDLSQARNKLQFLKFQRNLLTGIKFNVFQHHSFPSIPKECFWQSNAVYESVRLPCCGKTLCKQCWEEKSLDVGVPAPLWDCDCGQTFLGQSLLSSSQPHPDKFAEIQCYNKYEHARNCLAFLCLQEDHLLSTMAARSLASQLNFKYEKWVRMPNPFRF